jgi:peptide deformylase
MLGPSQLNDTKVSMKILCHPNPTLTAGAIEVDPLNDDSLRPLAERMATIMYEAPGIGLAAPQIGVMKRVIVYDLSEDGTGLTALCNPVIVERSEECVTEEEGCLSVPGMGFQVARACRVTCEGLSLDGEPVRIEAEGLEARLFQHEVDHLDGVLIVDRATPDERKAAYRRLRELRDQDSEADTAEI